MTSYSRTTSSGRKLENWVCVVKPNDETSDTNEDVKTETNTKHMRRDTWQVVVHVVFLLVRVVVILTHYSPHRVAQAQGSTCPRVCNHLIHACNERYSSSLSSPFHPTSYSSYSPSIYSSSCCPSTSTKISSNTVYAANKEMGSTDESYSLTSAVVLQSGLNESWWAHSMECYNVIPVCETSQIYYRMGRRPMKDDLEKFFKKEPFVPFGSLVEYHHITAKDQSRIHQFEKKVLLGLFFEYALYVRGSWKGDVLIADLEE